MPNPDRPEEQTEPACPACGTGSQLRGPVGRNAEAREVPADVRHIVFQRSAFEPAL
ncbi:hypothetical protein ACQEVB_29995 [Pseudonocardia sp. CA-107938]|uniref:hypothetical protein n=1 Tax=Pseudonocardia sp. CA-107938 TaxID=3240021 RepID=UPI003D8B2DEF